VYDAGGMMSFLVKSKTADSVKCEVIDGGELGSRRHLNVRGKSATLPSITGQNSYHFLILLIIVVSYGYSLYIDLLQRRIGMT
jgi:pyruvate kinase